MKKLTKIFVAALVIASSSVSLFAQNNFRTAYFLEGYSYRYKFNPALAPERSYVSPVIGNTTLGVDSNLSLANFLWKDDEGNLNLFTKPGNTDEFIRNLKDMNNADVSAALSVFSVGFWNKPGTLFHSIDWTVRSESAISMPKSLLEIMKLNSLTDNYTLDGIGFSNREWSELSYGISGNIKGVVHIGARLKLLLGLSNMEMKVDNLSLTNTAPGVWSATGSGYMDLYLPHGTTIPTKGEIDPLCPAERANRLKFSETSLPEKKLEMLWPVPGIGVSADFGISANIGRYVEVSASLLDLGIMRWNNHMIAYTPSSSWTVNGLGYAVESALEIKDQWSCTTDFFDEVLPFEMDNAEAKSVSNVMTMTVNTGVNVKMPFYDRLSFGLLGVAHIDNRNFNVFEGRFITSVCPLNWLDIAAGYAYNNFGHSTSLVLNMHMKGLNLFLGTDSFLPLTKWSNGIPAGRLNTSVSFGLNFCFGENRLARE